MTDVYILSAARTAIGGFGGSLSTLSPIDLATHAAQAAIARAGIEAGQIGTSVFGHVLNTEPRDMYLSRVALAKDMPPYLMNLLVKIKI